MCVSRTGLEVMKQLTPTGRTKDIPTKPYLVDWEGEQGSQFSAEVLDFLRPYWRHDVVLSEWPVAGTRLRYDYVNLSRRIVVESDGVQHGAFNEHLHQGSRVNYLNQIKRDLLKDKMAERNGFLMVRITPDDMPLTRDFFKRQFDIDL